MHDAAHWDSKHARADRGWSATPHATVEQALADIATGTALDLGAGDGRHSVWLAQHGWQVTAVDFSEVGISRGRTKAKSLGVEVTWVISDVNIWTPQLLGCFDVVLVSFIHLDQVVFTRVRQWLAPGGRLVVVGHSARTPIGSGPRNPAFLYDEDQLRSAADGLLIERLGAAVRSTPDGDAIDIVLVARRIGGG